MVLPLAVLLGRASAAEAWTSAYLFNVNVHIEMASKGKSAVTTDARFVVEAGRFHGFDLMELQGAEIVEEDCFAFRDDGLRYKVSFKKVKGRTRVLLADDAEVTKGGITFQLVHSIDFLAQGALGLHDGRARFDWTPLVWDEGLDNMSITVMLPKSDDPGQIEVERTISRDYVVEVGNRHVNAIKYRPVRWYPMRIAILANPHLFAGLAQTAKIPASEPQPAPFGSIEKTDSTLSPALLFPALAVILGLLSLILKHLHVRAAYRQIGLAARASLLKRTSFGLRVGLAVLAAAVGLFVQVRGHLAAGVPAMAITAALFAIRRMEVDWKPRPGGAWREMSEEDLARCGLLTSAYLKSRVSMFDITTCRGVVAFVAFIISIGLCACAAATIDTGAAFAGIIDGLILAAPAWMSQIRAELPVDSTLEGFNVLRRWRKSLSRLLGARTHGAEAKFWVREDDGGPIEVRLRAAEPMEGIFHIEVGGETVRAGSTYKTRTVFVLRLEPGGEIGRKLASCEHAAEHHLTADLKEEIIVLRNRRGGQSSGISPLRSALSRI